MAPTPPGEKPIPLASPVTSEGRSVLARMPSLPDRLDGVREALKGVSDGLPAYARTGRLAIANDLLRELVEEVKEITADVRAFGVAPADGGACYDCGRPYGDEHGFPDLVVPHAIWNEHISPTGGEGGLLCPSCMCKRAHAAGLSNVFARFMSGPFCTERVVPVVGPGHFKGSGT